jgi:hypothetical protein
MVQDLREVYRPGDRYIEGLLDQERKGDKTNDVDYYAATCWDPDPMKCVAPADQAKRDAQEALMKIHMESRSLIKIPILGVAIHVNDLGLIGGITLIVLLLLTRTSLSREIKNLNYSFKKAYEANKLDEFYDALAMRQLFTVPHMKGEERNRFLSKAPYVVCLFPAMVYVCLVAYDVLTVFVLRRYREPFEHKKLFDLLMQSSVLWLIVVEGICVLAICFIALRCAERQHYIYSTWDNYWQLTKHDPTLCLIEPGVAMMLAEDEDYFVNIREGVKSAVLSEKIKSELRQAKEHTQPGSIYFARWLWHAVKAEVSPAGRFIPQLLHLAVSHKRTTAKPILVQIDPELATLFSNDKEINKTLREILQNREREGGYPESKTGPP